MLILTRGRAKPSAKIISKEAKGKEKKKNHPPKPNQERIRGRDLRRLEAGIQPGPRNGRTNSRSLFVTAFLALPAPVSAGFGPAEALGKGLQGPSETCSRAGPGGAGRGAAGAGAAGPGPRPPPASGPRLPPGKLRREFSLLEFFGFFFFFSSFSECWVYFFPPPLLERFIPAAGPGAFLQPRPLRGKAGV